MTDIKQCVFGFFNEKDPMNINMQISSYLNKIDSLGYDIHIFDNIKEYDFSLNMIYTIIRDVVNGRLESTRYLFLTDIPKLHELAYKVFSYTFSAFILLFTENIDFMRMKFLENAIYNNKITNELIKKPVYTNCFDSKINKIYGSTHNINNLLSDLDFLPICKNNIEMETIYFLFNNKYHLFEPQIGEKFKIIAVNDNSVQPNKLLNNIDYIKHPKFVNTIFEFPFNKKILTELIDFVNQVDIDIIFYYRNYYNVEIILKKIKEILKSPDDIQKKGVIKLLEILNESYHIHTQIFVYTILIYIIPDPIYKTLFINRILNLSLTESELSKDAKYSIICQILRQLFINYGTGDDKTQFLLKMLYRNIYNDYYSVYKDKLTFIPKENRDENCIVIIAKQMLGLGHGPTKTALDRAYSFIKYLNKNVQIINTKDILIKTGNTPFFYSTIPNEIIEYENITSIKYLDVNIPFTQLKGEMPNHDSIMWLIDYIKLKKPYLLFLIGGESIVADLLSNIAPTVCQTLGPSALTLTEGQFQVIGRKITYKEEELINKFGFKKEHVIETLFTSNFKPQASKLTREDLMLPQSKFLLLIVGGRLTEEVNDDFINMLISTLSVDDHFVFAGKFNNYSDYCDKIPLFKLNSTFLGMQQDMLAVCEVCDLYVNPKRAGGGTSVAEAMYKGLPAVTTDFGDVAVGAGNKFQVKDYNEMSALIMKYAKDKEFYLEMSGMARERAKQLMNTDKNLKYIYDKVTNSSLFT